MLDAVIGRASLKFSNLASRQRNNQENTNLPIPRHGVVSVGLGCVRNLAGLHSGEAP